ncbi:MAG: GAF domain-containing protein, partial [bacterium]
SSFQAIDSKYISQIVEISQIFSEQKSIISLIETIKTAFANLLSTDRAVFFLLDMESDKIIKFQPDGTLKNTYASESGIVGRSIQENKIIILPDLEHNDKRLDTIDKITGYTINNLLCIPLRNRSGKVIGAVELYNKLTNFTSQDENILNILSSSATAALENIIELEKIKKKNQRCCF